jgi:hypothetical protein
MDNILKARLIPHAYCMQLNQLLVLHNLTKEYETGVSLVAAGKASRVEVESKPGYTHKRQNISHRESPFHH